MENEIFIGPFQIIGQFTQSSFTESPTPVIKCSGVFPYFASYSGVSPKGAAPAVFQICAFLFFSSRDIMLGDLSYCFAFTNILVLSEIV